MSGERGPVFPVARCGRCGKMATGYAKISKTRLCHGDNDPTPTCYERSQRDGWTPVMVAWDQWYDERERDTEVVSACVRCIPDGRVPLLVSVVSPRGVAHEAERGDITDCGKKCTGPEWWHRL